MAGIDKIVAKMKNQPNGINYDDAVKVMNANGYRLVRQNGSHCHFRNLGGDLITIKKSSPTLKRVYVEDILTRIGK